MKMKFYIVILACSAVVSHGATIPEVASAIDLFGESDNYTVENLIESFGYPAESHELTTTDGYILTLHRIPFSPNTPSNGKVAFLQHGLFSSAADWCITGPEKSLAFRLSDQGYDVWMGNARGNTWSRKHKSLSPDDAEFWQFSWHEIGTIDVPEMIDYVLSNTGNLGVYYVGHSQGTTVYFVMNSERPQWGDKVVVAVLLAPIGFMSHMKSPLTRIAVDWMDDIIALTDLLNMHEILPSNNFTKFFMGDHVCKENPDICTNILFAFLGFNQQEMNATLLPHVLKFSPAGASFKQLIHYGQEIRSGYFRQFDYGATKNLEKYGSISPPDYDLNKTTSPTYFLYSLNDWMAAVKDVEKLFDGITGASVKEKILITDPLCNHIDFLFGINVSTWVNDQIIDIFTKH